MPFVQSLASTLLSLRTLLALSFALLTAVLTGVLAYSVSEQQARLLQREIGGALATVAAQMRQNLDTGMFERYRDIQVAASLPAFRAGQTDPAGRRALLDTLQRTYPAYAWIGFAEPDGTVRQATGGLLEGADVSQRPWFRAGLKAPSTLDVHEAKLLARLLPAPSEDPLRFVDVAAPVTDAQGRVIGVLGAHLSWNWAREVERAVLRPRAGQPVQLLVLSRNGEILLGPRSELGKTFAPERLAAIRPGEDVHEVRIWPDGRPYLTAYAKTQGHMSYAGLGWTVVVRQPVDEAFAPVASARQRIVGIGAAIGLVFIAIGLALARRLSKPLRALACHADSLRRGQTAAAMPIVGGYTEASVLSRSLHELICHRERAERALQELNQTLEQRIEARTEEITIINRALSKAMEHQFQIQQSLADEKARVQSILHNAHEAYIGIDQNGCVTEWNEQAEHTFGWTRSEAVGRLLDDLVIPVRYREAHRQGMAHLLATGEGPVLNRRIELNAVRRDDVEIPIEISIAAVRTEEGLSFHAFLHDVSERRRAEQDLRQSRERLQTITDNVPVLIAYIDPDLGYRFHNRTYLEWFGRMPGGKEGRTMRDFLSPGDLAELEPQLRRVLAGEAVSFEKRWHRPDGPLDSLMTYLPHRDEHGAVQGFYVLGQDITARKQLERSLEELALNDTLTGLPNRRALIKTLTAALPLTRRTGKALGLLFLDLDGFKAVNDRLGHEAGDELLRQVARRLRKQVRQTDTVARLGGDEFTVVLDLLNDGRRDAEAVAEKIIAALGRPFRLGEATAHISASVGIAVHGPGDDGDPQTLLAAADAAMYRAKGLGKSRYA